MEGDKSTKNAATSTATTYALIGVMVIAVGGFVVGTRAASPPDMSKFQPASSGASSAYPGQTYRELRLRKYGANAKIRSDLGKMHAVLPAVSNSVQRTEQQLEQALAARAQRRAFDGAPPVIPHPIDQQDPSSCLSCHGEGIEVQGHVAPKIPHRRYKSCVQCHVTTKPRYAKAARYDNSFVGATPVPRGSRAWTGAPPVMPHPVWMRQNCSSCHGVAGPVGLRTPHPWRKSCTQCHAPSAKISPPWAKR